MSQRFHVLRCYKCETFQSHIVKKSNKWDCKMCGDKQSLMKVFGEGTGKECRLHVQKLNTLRMIKETDSAVSVDVVPSQPVVAPLPGNRNICDKTIESPSFTSKWAKYIETPTSTIEPEGLLNESSDLQYVLELPDKKQKPKTSIKLANSNNMFVNSPVSKGKRKSDQLNEDCDDCEDCLDNNFIDRFIDENVPYNKSQMSQDICKPKTKMVEASSSKWAKYTLETKTSDE